MIIKERSPAEHNDSDRFAKAGAEAELQLAFYLRRAFAEEAKLLVLNDLRLLDPSEDAAQLDHLIIHRGGLIIIESKSAVGRIRINRHGEWIRYWNNQPQGMPSPIIQAALQAKLLRQIIRIAVDSAPPSPITDSLKIKLPKFHFDSIVAFSTSAVIEREMELPMVCKADQVPERVVQIVKQYYSNQKNHDATFNLASPEREFITRVLLARHAPLVGAFRIAADEKTLIIPKVTGTIAIKVPPRRDTSPKQCRFCGSNNLKAQYGRNYYFFCLECKKNTPCDLKCLSCSAKARIRKDGMQFFKECSACNQTLLYWTNGSG